MSVCVSSVAPIDDVYGTLGLVKATKTQEYSDVSEIAEELVGKGSYTMFAPSNDAWEQLDHVSRHVTTLSGDITSGECPLRWTA